MRNYFHYIFLLCIGFTGFSQNLVSGNVVSYSRQALSGAHIQLNTIQSVTDERGVFTYSSIPSGEHHLVISHIGYTTLDTIILVHKDLKLYLNLKPKVVILDEIQIKHQSNPTNIGVQDQLLHKSFIEKYSSQSLGDALKEIVGVSVLKSGASVSKPIINGLHSSRIPVFSNHVRLEDQQWGIEHAPNFDVNSAGKIAVIKGASALQYSGDAIGGLIVTNSAVLKKDTLVGQVMTTLVSNGKGGTLNAGFQKGNYEGWRWQFNTTFKYLGDKEAPDYVLDNTGNRALNFSGNVDYVFDNKEFSGFYSFYNVQLGILNSSHVGNATDLYSIINQQHQPVHSDFSYGIENPFQDVQHHLAKISYTNTFSENSFLKFQYAFQYNQRYEYDIRRGETQDKAALDLTLITHNLLVDYEYKNQQWVFKTGISGSLQDNYADPKTGVRPLIPTFQKWDVGTYALLQKDWESNVKAEVGLRYDFTCLNATKYYLKSRWEERNYNVDFAHFIVGDFGNQWLTEPQFTYHNVAASFGITKTLGSNWNLGTHIGFSNRNPNPSELFSDGLHHSIAQIELGDLRLKKEQSIKWIASLENRWNSFLFSVNPYLHIIDDFIYLKPIGVESTIRGAFISWEYQQDKARLLGLDVQANWKITPSLTYKSSFAFLEGKNSISDTYLVDMPPFQMNNGLHWTSRKAHQLTFGVQNEWVFKQNHFPNYNFDMTIIENNEYQQVTLDISSSPKAYSLWNFEASMKQSLFRKNDVTISLFVQNALNTNYRDYLNKQRFFADETGRNIQLQLKYII